MAMVYVCNVSRSVGTGVERLPLPGDGGRDPRPFDPDIPVRVRTAEEAYREVVANAAPGEVERLPLPGHDWKGR